MKIDWNLLVVAVVLVVLMSLVFTACGLSKPPVSPVPIPTPGSEIDVRVVQGRPLTQAAVNALALEDECMVVPLMQDVRSADDPSLSILPRLNPGDFNIARDWAGFIVRDEYGCRRAQSGERYLDLNAIELKCGPAVLQAQVRDESNAPKEGNLVFLNWPGADQFPVTVDPPCFQNGVGGFTDWGGSVGFGFGPGSQLTPGSGGPFNVWGASDPSTWTDRVVGSDMLGKVGWFDNHCIFNPVFKIVRKAGAVPPTPMPGEGNRLLDFDTDGNVIGALQFQVGVPPVGVRRLGLYSGDTELGWLEWNAER